MSKIKFFSPFLFVALLASCQQTNTPAETAVLQEPELTDEVISAEDDFTPQGLEVGADVEAMANPTSIKRSDVLARGKRWVDKKVPYDMNKQFEGWRTDCSGFVSMAWNVAKPGASTATLWNYATRLSSPDDLQPGDAVNSSASNKEETGASAHVVLFVKWVDKKNHVFLAYEEKGKKYGTVDNNRQLIYNSTAKRWDMKGSKKTGWNFMRRKNITN